MNVVAPRALLLVLAAGVLTAACGSSSSSTTSTTSTDDLSVGETTSSDGVATTTSAASENTGGPARDRLLWILALVEGPPVDRAVVEAGFAPEFLEAIPYEQVVTIAAQVFGGGTGWTIADDRLERFEGEATVRSASGAEVTVSLAVEEAAPHRITGLQFLPVIPAPFGPDEAVTVEAISALLAEQGPAAFGVFDVSDGTCRELAGEATDRPLPIGSAFKLWVLGALALEVEAGRAAWDEPLAVSDALKSSTDGEISPLPDGTTRTLREFAEVMISISDNSATDHLMARVGRERVEAAMAAAGVADPSANIPMITTRELFLLKWSSVVDTDEYLGLDAEGRRAVLDGRLAGVSLLDALDPAFRPTAPTRIDSLEWLATPADLCRTHVWLAELAERPGLEPVADILRLNPGVPFDDRWTDVRFKGGSEPGVVFGAWRLADADGRAFVIAGGVADPLEVVDELSVAVTLAAAARLPELG